MRKIDAHAHLGHWAFPISNAGTAESLVRMCEKYDMQYCAASATQALTYDMQAGNEQMAEAVERYEPILGYCYCNPNFLEQSVAEMERYLPMEGFVGVKIHGGYSACATGAPQMQELMPEIAARTSVVKIHTAGADVAGALARYADEYPSLNIIIAHALGSDYVTAAALASAHSNIYLDFTSSWARRGKIEHALATCGAGQIVFGTDMDLFEPAFTLGMFEGAGLDEQQARAIYYDNAAKLFGVQ
ncbi:MAG: amidohydrolase family protein [Armatimonadetes bacterium]|nr:amidohydrolase family protein [Armatimonadota bacterium]